MEGFTKERKKRKHFKDKAIEGRNTKKIHLWTKDDGGSEEGYVLECVCVKEWYIESEMVWSDLNRHTLTYTFYELDICNLSAHDNKGERYDQNWIAERQREKIGYCIDMQWTLK